MVIKAYITYLYCGKGLSGKGNTTNGRCNMNKASMLKHWAGIEPGQPVNPQPVPYKHSGSTYAQDGIRITGSREFIDAVLSRLKDLLAHENGNTRLQVNYQQTQPKDGVPLHRDGWNCYVQVHTRGREARMVNAIFGGM